MNHDFYTVFPWNKNFETGIKQIDDQHKSLIDLLNRLANTLVENNPIIVKQAFNKLADYASFHFKDEEMVWVKYFNDDTWFNSHRKNHENFLPSIDQIKKEQSHKSDYDIIEQIIRFLIRWLAFHIIDGDKRMAIAVQSLNNGASLDEAKSYAEKTMDHTLKLMIETILNMYDKLSVRTLGLLREKAARNKAEKDKEELFHILCHDLKNPFTQVYQSLDITFQQPELIKEMHSDLRTSVSYGLNIIERTRDLFNNRKLELSPVDLTIAINEAFVIIDHQLKEKNIRISFKPINGAILLAEKTILVNSVIVNLLTNAIKFSHKNSKIHIAIKMEDNNIKLLIKDEGIGFPDEMLMSDKIISQPGTNNEDSTGFGLRLVRKYLEVFNGEITISNNNGAEVILTFNRLS